MALSPKEREKIVEEETVRFETRQSLHSAQCSRKHGRRFGWLWLVAVFILGYAAHGLCGRVCPFGGGGWHAHCMMGAGQEGVQAPTAPDQSKP